jgi:uncharacterized protein YcbX
MQPSIAALYVYPVKSCRGIAIDTGQVTARGFAYDRRWMVVDDRGSVVTQRQVRELCLVDTALEGDSLVLAAEGAGSIRLPAQHEEGPELECSIWQHTGKAVRHAEGSAWMSALLGRESSLVYMAERHQRPVDPGYALPHDRVSFADDFPFLVISEASLEELNTRLEQSIGMERFRPNIVVRGVAPFAEDAWRRVRMGGITFRAAKACSRCAIPTIDQRTASKSAEPLRTLSAYRSWDGGTWFGMNLIGDDTGVLSIGDAVRAL